MIPQGEDTLASTRCGADTWVIPCGPKKGPDAAGLL